MVLFEYLWLVQMSPTMITQSAKPAVNILLLPPTYLLCPEACPVGQIVPVYPPLRQSPELSSQDGNAVQRLQFYSHLS